MSSWSVAWASWVERHYKGVLLGSLALAVGCTLSLFSLRLDLDVLEMLPRGAPAFDNFKTFVAEFGELDELIILVEGDEAAQIEAFADDFVARLRALDTVVRVQGRLDPEPIYRDLLGRYVYNYLPLEAQAKLAERLTEAGIEAQVAGLRKALGAPFDLSMAQWVRRDPLGIARLAAEALAAGMTGSNFRIGGGYLANPEGTAILLMVRPRQNAFDIEFSAHFLDQVRDAEAMARRSAPASFADLVVGYTGSYAFALEDAATIKHDIATYTILSLIGVLATFYAGYRRLRILPFVTYPLIISTLVSFAGSLLVYSELNAVSICFAALLYGLSMDSGVHYYTYLVQERRRASMGVAVARTLSGLGAANVVATTTTAASFAVIGFSQLKGIGQLGSLTGLGMMVTMAQFFLLYPALSFAMPASAFETRELATPLLGRMAAACARRAVVVRVLAGGLAVLLTWAALGVGLDVDLTNLRPGGTTAVRVQERIAARFGTDAAAGAALVRAASVEAALQDSEALAAQLASYRQEGLLRSFRGIAALLPSEHEQRLRLDAVERLPRTQVAQWLRAALARHGFAPQAFQEFFDDWMQPKREILRFDAPVFEPLRPLIDRHVRQGEGVATVATYIEPVPGAGLGAVAERVAQRSDGSERMVASRSLLEEALGYTLRRELVVFFVLSFVLNLLLIWWNFRNLRVTAAILLPQALVIAACFAAMRGLGVAIDPVNLIIVPLIIGIGVDYSVYVAARWQQGDDWQAALSHGGRALAVSAFSTMAGFGFLGLSEFPALARMGVFMGIGLFLCLLCSFTLLPALIPRRPLSSPQPSDGQEAARLREA